jgi:GxxExxY protein
MRDIDLITGDVLDLSIRLHRELGPGLLETVYETVLAGSLARMGYRLLRQQPVDIEFEGMRFSAAFRIDILVDDRLLIEIRSIDKLHAVQQSRCLLICG